MRISVLMCGLLICAALFAQVAEKANENYRSEAGRAKIALGIGHADRDARQKPEELIRALNIQAGTVVADVGTGVGYMLPHLSRAVGPNGKVIAEDIFPDFLKQAQERAASLKNVEFVSGTEKSAELAPASVDLVLVLDAYHHFDYPDQMLASIKRGLKPGGKLSIVEYHKTPEAMPNGNAVTHVRLGVDDAIREIEGYGWKLASRSEFIPKVQWLGTFQPR